jgi:hypothetical protein
MVVLTKALASRIPWDQPRALVAWDEPTASRGDVVYVRESVPVAGAAVAHDVVRHCKPTNKEEGCFKTNL